VTKKEYSPAQGMSVPAPMERRRIMDFFMRASIEDFRYTIFQFFLSSSGLTRISGVRGGYEATPQRMFLLAGLTIHFEFFVHHKSYTIAPQSFFVTSVNIISDS
jgi:hypothetical protein